MAAGGRMAFGTDGISFSDHEDFFQEVRLACYLQRLPRDKGLRRDIDEGGDLAIRRIGKVLDRFGESFLDRIYSDEERWQADLDAHSQVAELRHEMLWENSLTALFFDDGNDFVFDELPRRLAHQFFFVVQ